MVFERPKRPNQPHQSQSTNPALARPDNITSSQRPQRRDTQGGGGSRNDPPRRGNSGGNQGGGQNGQPTHWLVHPLDPSPSPDPSASFVEYLRWLREPGAPTKDGTKSVLVDLAQRNGDYRAQLQQLTKRTELIAGPENCFEAQVQWRLRAGGTKGPESMLLPAFDALGMPYLPSSALRGVARAEAIREFQQKENLDWKEAEKRVAPWFGSLEAEGVDRSGKVIFLDAYPLPTEKTGGLSVDIANSIWTWEGESLKYNPNPNLLFSLQESTLLIGLRKGPHCTDEKFEQVKTWLKQGLCGGIGSQVNSGYGQLQVEGVAAKTKPFLEVEFELEGQLIHGRQEPSQWKQDKNCFKPGHGIAETRPIAFKSVLRYWFRAFALGVLAPEDTRKLESKLFGDIQPPPPQLGWLKVTITGCDEPQREGKKPGYEAGVLQLWLSPSVKDNERDIARDLFKTLTWLAFHLGGVGQGARRPCYSRMNRPDPRPPYWRGNDLIALSDEEFWKLPIDVESMQHKLKKRIQDFYRSLVEVANGINGQDESLKLQQLHSAGNCNKSTCPQAVDINCRIVVCSGRNQENDKLFALGILHSRDANQNARGSKYDPDLCGWTERKDESGSKIDPQPSPVWIANFRDDQGEDLYQVVTVFGATQNPRKKYLELLKERSDEYRQVFPLSSQERASGAQPKSRLS